jgi:phage terminase large subunit-like protein
MPRPLRPHTVDHFKRYAGLMVLDTGDYWRLEPFQLDVVVEIFAGTDEVWLDIPEGNGKTTLLAGVALYHADYTEAASVPMAASSRDQTGVLLSQAAGFVRRTPGMEERFRVYEGYRRIDALRTGGRIQVYAADDRTGDGVIPTLALLEELHRHPDLRLYRTWRGKLGKRGGQLVAISTAGEPGAEYETAKAEALKRADVTREGARTIARAPHFTMHQHALKVGDNVNDLQLVKQANPFSGVTLDELRRKHDSPTMLESHWARFVCGIATRGEQSAVSPEEWAGLPNSAIPAGEPVWAGLDLGWKWDTTAVVPLWLPEPNRRVLGMPEVVTPPRDGTSTPPQEIRDALLRVHARNPIHTVVLDPNAGGEQLVEWIEGPELGARAIPYSQANVAQALALERWMEAVREGWLEHPHHDTLTLHVLNAIAKPVLGDRYRFDRPRQTRQGRGQDQRVIDCLQAASAVHAVAVAEVPEEEHINVADYRIVRL